RHTLFFYLRYSATTVTSTLSYTTLFRSRVPGEALYFIPYPFDNVLLVPSFLTLLHKPSLYAYELLARPILTRHPPSQNIGLGQRQSGEMVCYFDNILLVHHNAERFFQQFVHLGMNRLIGAAVAHRVKSFNICAHHPRTRHSGSDDRTRRDQRRVVFALELAQQHAHRR